jgi:hypothetical protein
MTKLPLIDVRHMAQVWSRPSYAGKKAFVPREDLSNEYEAEGEPPQSSCEGNLILYRFDPCNRQHERLFTEAEDAPPFGRVAVK